MDTPDSLAADMLKAAAEAVVLTQGVVKKGAQNVKTTARENAKVSSGRHASKAPNFIGYDVTVLSKTIKAEIGYADVEKTQAQLSYVLEYGTSTSPAHRDLGRALDSEAPKFGDYLARMAAGLL